MAHPPVDHGGLDGPHARRDVADRGARECATAHLRRRGLPARAGRAAGGRWPRGVEHLRPHRSDGGGVRGPARRLGAGADRAPARRLGARRRRRRGRAGRRGPDRRAHHRRRRPRPLPRPRERPREVRADADARLGPRLPVGRPRALRRRRSRLPGSRRRSGQGGRTPHRTRRGGVCAAGPARCDGRGRRRAHDRRGRARARRLPGGGGRVRPVRRARRPRHDAAGRRRAAPRRRRRAPGAHVRQGRPRRPPVAAPRHRDAGHRAQPRRSVAGRAVAGGARSRRARPQGRLLRPRRRIPLRGAAGVAHPRARARILGRRHLRRAAPRCDGQGARSVPDRRRRAELPPPRADPALARSGCSRSPRCRSSS